MDTLSILKSLLAEIKNLGAFAYVIIFFATFFESAAFAGFVLPGETFVIFVGFLSARRYLMLKYTLLAVLFGALFGDNAGYFMGRRLGRGYFREHKKFLLLKKEHLDTVDEYFARRGGAAVVIGRFISFIRSVTAFSAGLGRMRYARFAVYNVIGCISWTLSFTLLGYFFGRNLNLIETWLGRAGIFVFSLMALALIFFYIYPHLRRRKHDRS